MRTARPAAERLPAERLGLTERLPAGPPGSPR
jgi:hypothetical protein